MASYPNYNPSVWTNGISQSEFNYLFGSASGEPVMNWATQGEYAPGSTFKVTSTAAAVGRRVLAQRRVQLPGVGEHRRPDVRQRRRPEPRQHDVLRGADPVLRLGLLQPRLRRCGRPTTTRPTSSSTRTRRPRRCSRWSWTGGSATTPASTCRKRPAGTIPTRQWLYWMWEDNAHKGQNWCKNGKANGSYVQQIEYDNCHRRLGLGTRPGRHRRDRPGLRDLDPAAAHQRLHRARQRRHALQPADRRGPRLRRRGSWCSRSTRR